MVEALIWKIRLLESMNRKVSDTKSSEVVLYYFRSVLISISSMKRLHNRLITYDY